MSDASERHNEATLPILREITRRIGTEPSDLLVFAETIVVGIFLLVVKMGGDEPVADVFIEGVKQRLAEQRLGELDAGELQ